jgi:hypothetical protein
MEARFAIIAWDVLIIDEEPMPCHAPVISPDGDIVLASNHLWCVLCQSLVHYGGTINHYTRTRHVRTDAELGEEIQQLSDPSGTTLALDSSILQRWEAYTALEFFRAVPAGQWLRSQKQLGSIAQILKARVQESLRESCEGAEYVNLAVDGWSDPRGRRYQGVTIRFVDGMVVTPAALLAIKEVKSVHEWAAELSAMVRCFQWQFCIAEKTLNSCSDRCSINARAFRRDKRELSTVFGELWLPCVCHLLNNVIAFFMSRITGTARSIFWIRQQFRKCGPVLAYL